MDLTTKEIVVEIFRNKYYFFQLACKHKKIPLILTITVYKQERSSLNYSVYYSNTAKHPTQEMLNSDLFDIQAFNKNPKIIRIYDDEINSTKQFTKDNLYFSIRSPYRMTLGLKIQFYRGLDEAYKWKQQNKKDVFQTWSERMKTEGKFKLLAKDMTAKSGKKLKYFDKMVNRKDLSKTQEIEKRPFLRNLLVRID